MSHEDLRPLVSSGSSADDRDDESHYGNLDSVHHSSKGQRSNRVSPLNNDDVEIGLRKSSSPPDRTAVARQTLSALGYCMGAFAMGNMLGWSSPSLPQLEDAPSSHLVTGDPMDGGGHLRLSKSQAGWVGALICLGALVQGPFTGICMIRFGRRTSMILMSAPLFLGWMLIASATDVWMLYAGRLVTGYAAGAYSVVAPIYIGEIASPEIRGTLGTLFQIMVVLGIFGMYIGGLYFSWQALALVAAGIACLTAIIMLFLKDSPTSYMSLGRPDLARKTMVWLRNSADMEEELYAIQKSVEEARRSGVRYKVSDILCVADPVVRKPVLITIFLMVNQQLSGINAVVVFTVNIFQSSGSNMDPNVATIIIGGIMVVATILSALIVNRIGRRPTLLWTQGIMAVSLLAFGTFFYLKEFKPEYALSLQWLPVTVLVVYIVAFSFGLGPLAWLMLGELLAPKIAGVAGGLASMVNWSLAFVVTVCFNYLTQALGDYGTYWLFAGFCFLGMVFTSKYLPETRGKSLREIQEYFRR